MRFKELSYANDADPRLKRWLIRSIEGLSGRDHYVRLYDIWRSDIIGKSDRVFGRLLELIDVELDVRGNWPLQLVPAEPIVVVANHPFGIGDGVAVLALAEQLGRPFKVLIHNDLLKVPEMEAYSLPISFEESRQAAAMNMRSRNEAVRLLREGTTIIVFPAGGVATARRGFGRAEDLPWKMFPAKLIQATRASVLPVYFEGQNGRLFHLASRVSMTLRLALLIREFRRLSGSTMTAHVGQVLSWESLSDGGDRRDLLARLHEAVFSMALPPTDAAGTFRMGRNRWR
ncbi:lysophospholipid acyltransferase family protein [Rhizobium lentis]|uniref:lysophospholipid acyltransferase family protein n=1 Tax=Rhizobium lentis TaxID=1138194 RepID=UPI001A92F60E|nr:lysophospholipid acyltransferase family protein [Rhizobium lentis]MBX5063656.1 glycerol acyltransferase [Rhizobium lentis]MBX5075762.1 glycerol acyltransferase [Rhizobium lentis]QSW93399.1 lysophospholipid acyltransferase family protein [Rhizobium lentis]